MKALLGMYSLREAMAKDLEGTLAQAKALGFDGVELAYHRHRTRASNSFDS